MNIDIGLKRGKVFLADYSGSWSQTFSRERRALNEANPRSGLIPC